MSTYSNLNMSVELIPGLPEEITKWLTKTNEITSEHQYDDTFDKLLPNGILNADRMHYLKRVDPISINYETDRFSFTQKDNGLYELSLSITHKDKDNDISQFITLILPYVVNFEDFTSIILLTTDYDTPVSIVNIMETLSSNNEIDSTILLLPETNFEDRIDLNYLKEVRRYCRGLASDIEYDMEMNWHV